MKGRLILAPGLAVVMLWARRGGLRHVIVEGDSMAPTLRAGDRLVLVRTPGPPRQGRVALVRDPRVPDRQLLKRVREVTPDGVDVRGDHPSHSTDSRHFGRLPVDHVRTYLVWRYATAARTALPTRPAHPRRVAVSWSRARAGRSRSPRQDRR